MLKYRKYIEFGLSLHLGDRYC